MPNNNYKHEKITFRQIGGVWQSDEQKPRTLAEFLDYYNLLFDDKCIFARYEIHRELRRQNNMQIEIRAFGGSIIRVFLNEF